MLSKSAVHRLGLLADYMEEQDPEHFNMSWWMNHPGSDRKHKHKFRRNQEITEKELHTCRTTACALGYAAVSPIGKVLGLSLVVESFDEDGAAEGGVQLFGESMSEFVAAQRAFDISDIDARYLFMSIPAGTPRQWAKKCREFIKVNS